MPPIAGSLRRVDPSRPRGHLHRAWAKLTATRAGLWTARTDGWRVALYLRRLSGGRLGTGRSIPTALLETTGARSGAPRRNGVIYFHDGERPPLVASKAGAPAHPAWFFNARAHPEVRLNGRRY